MDYLKKEELNSLTLEKYIDIVKNLSVIDKHDISGELIKHTVNYSYYHGLLVYQKRTVDSLVESLETLSSALKVDKSTEATRQGKKFTATFLEDFVQQDEGVIEIKENILEQNEIYGYLKSICSALEHKKDMLVQLSANLRSETKLYS